jgi:pimeloyl-ACP methyl ester carboxylesterase
MRAFFPRASLEVMPDCGHWLHVQNPQAFNTIVLRFLAPLEQRKLAIG